MVTLVAAMICLSFASYGQDDLSALLEKVEQGDADAQFLLGRAYYSGENVPQDYKEAMKWYRLAAKQGDVGAQFILGDTYWLQRFLLSVGNNLETQPSRDKAPAKSSLMLRTLP